MADTTESRSRRRAQHSTTPSFALSHFGLEPALPCRSPTAADSHRAKALSSCHMECDAVLRVRVVDGQSTLHGELQASLQTPKTMTMVSIYRDCHVATRGFGCTSQPTKAATPGTVQELSSPPAYHRSDCLFVS